MGTHPRFRFPLSRAHGASYRLVAWPKELIIDIKLLSPALAPSGYVVDDSPTSAFTLNLVTTGSRMLHVCPLPKAIQPSTVWRDARNSINKASWGCILRVRPCVDSVHADGNAHRPQVSVGQCARRPEPVRRTVTPAGHVTSWPPLSRTRVAMTRAWGAKVRGRRCDLGPIVFRPLMVKGAFVRPDRESGVCVSWECG